VFHQQEALSAGLLSSLEAQELCVTDVRRDVNSFILRLHKVIDLRGHHTEAFQCKKQISQVC
jgi:hypothetical protein